MLHFYNHVRYKCLPNQQYPSYDVELHRFLLQSPYWWPHQDLCKPESKQGTISNPSSKVYYKLNELLARINNLKSITHSTLHTL